MAMTMAIVVKWKDALKALWMIALVMATAALLHGWVMATVMELTNTGAVTCHAMERTMVTVRLMVDVMKAFCKIVLEMVTVVRLLG
jgi:hypothetical protein